MTNLREALGIEDGPPRLDSGVEAARRLVVRAAAEARLELGRAAEMRRAAERAAGGPSRSAREDALALREWAEGQARSGALDDGTLGYVGALVEYELSGADAEPSLLRWWLDANR